jgi:hypothetical protein
MTKEAPLTSTTKRANFDLSPAATIAAPSATSQTNADRETPPAAAKLLEPRRRFVGRSLTYSGSNNLPPRRCQHALG